MAILIVVVLGLLLMAWLMGEPWLTRRRRARLRSQPFPAEWRDILRRRVPYVRGLPADLQLRLKQHINVFLAEKTFIGCDGLEITDEIRVTIAAQACLLILKRPRGYYPQLRQILVYPGAFIVTQTQKDEMGLVQDQQRVLTGESWAHGQVILAWDDTLDGAAVVDDGRNVVIHEFAHQLDQEKGHASGAPILADRSHYPRWAQVLGGEFMALQEKARVDQSTLFSHYGATNPAEFFAVVSEVFFERPREMAEQHPALYRELGNFYRLDPLSW